MNFVKARFVFWLSLLLSLISFTSLIFLFRFETNSFQTREPYYKTPIRLNSLNLPIRNDAYGKGFFGASRGTNGHRRHKGLDILAPLSTPVYAAKSGRVTFAGWDKGYGLYIEIAHPDGLFTRYAHLSEVFVRQGDWIFQGSQIALSGRTGNALNIKILPHLHFEIRHPFGAVHPLRGLLDPKLKIT